MKNKHENQRFPCKVCDHQATTKLSLDIHIKAIHIGEKHQCKYCAKQFTHKSYLNSHMENIHKRTKRYKCTTDCNRIFLSREHRNAHKRLEHVDNPKKYSCNMCEYDTKRNVNLKRHQSTVHIRLEYSCPICDFKTNHQISLRKHIENRHKETKSDCDICDLIY